MAAVLGADDDDVEAACQRAEGEVWVANYNAPGQVVIAGTAEAVAAAGDHRQGARGPQGAALPGGRGLPHPADGAGPGPPAQGSGRHPLLTPPRFRWWPMSTPGSTPIRPSGPACCRPSCAARCGGARAWRRWASWGRPRWCEVGPGGVLTGLARRTLPDAQAMSVAVPDDLDKLVDTLSGTETWHAYAAAHQGEHLYTSERVVVSPAAGVFEPDAWVGGPRARLGSRQAPGQRRRGRRRDRSGVVIGSVTCSATSATTRCARRSTDGWSGSWPCRRTGGRGPTPGLDAGQHGRGLTGRCTMAPCPPP